MVDRRAGVLLALVGLALLAHPLYLFPHHGQSSVFVHQFEERGTERPGGEVVAYDDLPPAAQEVIDAAQAGESPLLWQGDDERAVDALENAEYLERGGTYYAYDLAHRGGLVTGFGTSLRVLLTGLGSLALVAGVLASRTESFRPLAPRPALAVPAVAAVAVAATNAYDVALSGASGTYVMAAEVFGPVAFLGVACASALRRGDLGTAGGVAALGVAASVLAVVAGADVLFALIIGVPSGVGALVLGALLTAPGPPPETDRASDPEPNRA